MAITGLMLMSLIAKGQDPSMSNFHLSRNFLNPAFAGYSQDLSLTLNNRLQWLKLSGFKRFNTYNFAANIGCAESKLGFALYASDNVEGEGFLRTTNAGFQIARYWPFDYKTNGSRKKRNNSIIAAGIQFGFGQKRLDWDRLTFSDQLSNSTYQMVRSTSVINPKNQSTEFRWDLGAGVRFLTELGYRKRASLSGGIALYHFITNQESFFSDNNDVIYPTRYNVHAFYSVPIGKAINSRWNASLGGVLNRQAGVTTFTIMTYADYVSKFRMGFGYRGKANGLPDAYIIQPTIRGDNLFGKDNWLLTATYEITSLSSVGQQRSMGTIELGISIRFNNSAICSSNEIQCFYPSKQMKQYSMWNY